jgi:two-component system, chemotaxis family, CheB/CheR fusion protein
MDREDLFVVGIGASAGGLIPLYELFSNMPDIPNVAFVIVRHLSPNHKTIIDILLSKYTHLPIYIISDGQPINPNCVYIMPEKSKVRIQDNHLFLEERKPYEIINHAIDEFFISLARDVKKKAVAIILSGAGNDGTKGATDIEQAGGIVIVQDPQSSQFDGMTSSAVYNDHPNYILYPKEMGSHLSEYINSKV